jgi:hypothetical protein
MGETNTVQHSGVAGADTDGRDKHCTAQWSSWCRYRWERQSLYSTVKWLVQVQCGGTAGADANERGRVLQSKAAGGGREMYCTMEYCSLYGRDGYSTDERWSSWYRHEVFSNDVCTVQYNVIS